MTEWLTFLWRVVDNEGQGHSGCRGSRFAHALGSTKTSHTSLCLLLHLVVDGTVVIWITTRVWSRATGCECTRPKLAASLRLRAPAPLNSLRVMAAPLYVRRHLSEPVDWSLPPLAAPHAASIWRFWPLSLTDWSCTECGVPPSPAGDAQSVASLPHRRPEIHTR